MIWMVERICGTITAAIMPWKKREAISISVFVREPGERRGEGEAGNADQEQLLVAENVAEPAAGDQEQREGQRIAGDDPLDRGVARRRVLRWIDGDRHVDDGGVQDVHEEREEHDQSAMVRLRPVNPAATTEGVLAMTDVMKRFAENGKGTAGWPSLSDDMSGKPRRE